MMNKFRITDPDILGSMAAVQRAAKRAQEIAIATGTPLIVVENKRSNTPIRSKSPESSPGVRLSPRKRR